MKNKKRKGEFLLHKFFGAGGTGEIPSGKTGKKKKDKKSAFLKKK
jgi:hypothetical protein